MRLDGIRTVSVEETHRNERSRRSESQPRYVQDPDTLVSAHLDLPLAVARTLQRRLPASFELDDLVQEGVIGLIWAAARYQPERGTPFQAFARPRVRGAILESCRRRNWREATHVSLDTGLGTEGHEAAVLCDRDLPDVRLTEKQATQRWRRLAQTLPRRELYIIEHYYFLEENLGVCGSALNVCPSRASQLHLRALARMRKGAQVSVKVHKRSYGAPQSP
jgi:RNA polymerase sigma factor (sigma-70 family)